MRIQNILPFENTCFRLRMRVDIKDWVKQCLHYMITYKWRKRGQEVMFLWLVSSSFTILHVDLSIPRHFTDINSNVAIINTTCGMIHFVVVVLAPNETSATLADYSMQHVFSKFSICYLVILDDGSPFKGAFSTICKALNINF